MESSPLTEKHRPSRLSEIVGQSVAISVLESFLESPHSQIFIFSGDTGTGKTSAAFALTNELSVNRDWNFQHIKSGELDGDSVQTALKTARFVGINDGWKLILCDEADLMSQKAKGLWLSALEGLPEKTIIVFTTNEPGKFDRRFLDRCEHVEFKSDKSLIPAAQTLLNRLWIKEGLKGNPPSVESTSVILDGVVSFRRVVRVIESEKRKQTIQPAAQTKAVSKPKQTVRL